MRPPYEIIKGDACDVSKLKPNTIDVTVTSPPYNVGLGYDNSDDSIPYDAYLDFSKQWLSNVYEWTKTTGRLCLNVGLDKNKYGKRPICADMTRIAQDVGWEYHCTIIWNEGNISRRTAWGSWLSASAPHVIAPVEVIIVLYKDEWKRNRRGESTISKTEFMDWTNGVWRFNGAKKNGHPAPFPVELPHRCIRLFSYVDDIIFDPFLGSGTTIIAAAQNGRKSLGIEISPEYQKLAEKLIQDAICQEVLPSAT